MTKPYRVQDLKHAPAGAFLFCPACFSEVSADAGDYFAADPRTELRCCNEPMRLVTKHTVYQDVKVPR